MCGSLADPRRPQWMRSFGAVVLAQLAHSIEEYFGRLWESFPPARLVSGLFSENLEQGFLIANGALLAVGLWCWLWPVRQGWRAAPVIAWTWVSLEGANGIGHLLWSLRQGGYTPGVATAPVLLVVAISLGQQLRQEGQHMGGAG